MVLRCSACRPLVVSRPSSGIIKRFLMAVKVGASRNASLLEVWK
jgi:hypothetical protein